MAEETKAAGPIRMVAIQNMVASIQYKGQILARTNKLESGILSTGLIGFAAGAVVSMVLVLVPVLFI
ncbi:MAG TPA: tetrahydromethanopterin S-methyltransferase subunit F [Methanoregulaceae archaeon]|nr:tetrahydromethanopterin S-methyltransferase subunit F [Methanoregulaceae archaeon]HQJ87843.1 tetrahydromethanopterin S-methyltransferase subunit F [Methanoregulaceae archaeon]